MAVSTIDPAELALFLDASRQVLRRATVRGALGDTLLPVPLGSGSPYVSTRDLCASISALVDLGELHHALPLCDFLLKVQVPTGAWEPRYDTNGVPLPLEPAEDVTALAIWALMKCVRASGDAALAEAVREPVEQATRYTLERTLNPYLYLVETTSSLHESGVSEGYDLWNNCAHAAAFALCHRQYGGERFRRLGLLIRRSIGLYMTQDGRFLRRLDRHGYPDPRPDIVLLSPYYFGLWAPNERAVMNSAELIERTLWNVEIGGYARFLPYSPDERLRFPGPWPLFSTWMAQFHFDVGNKDRAETIVRWLFGVMREGELPEMLVPSASVQRFGRERRRALGQPSALESGAVAAERVRLLAELDDLERRAEEPGAVPTGGPHVWAHLEALRALHKGGHVEHWEADPATHRQTREGGSS